MCFCALCLTQLGIFSFLFSFHYPLPFHPSSRHPRFLVRQTLRVCLFVKLTQLSPTRYVVVAFAGSKLTLFLSLSPSFSSVRVRCWSFRCLSKLSPMSTAGTLSVRCHGAARALAVAVDVWEQKVESDVGDDNFVTMVHDDWFRFCWRDDRV